MQTVLVVATLFFVACSADAKNQAPVAPVAPVAPLKFDSSRAWIDLQRQVAFGPRPAGSPALAQTRQYIESQLKAIDVPYREQTFDAMTPAGIIRMTNIIGTIPGRRPDRIGIATHYDTKRFAEFKFLGASDAASSTAARATGPTPRAGAAVALPGTPTTSASTRTARSTPRGSGAR